MENEQKGFGFGQQQPQPVPPTPIVPPGKLTPPEVPQPKPREPTPEEQAAATAIGLNYAGYAAQAARVAAWKNNARRSSTKLNADLSYAITKKLHGATFRARPLIINHLYSNGAIPKVGTQSTSSAEQYAPDGQGLGVMTPQWMNGYKTNIAGATTVNYTPVVGDVGKRLTVTMTPSTASRPGITYISNATPKVAA